jgi:hypothetical protein
MADQPEQGTQATPDPSAPGDGDAAIHLVDILASAGPVEAASGTAGIPTLKVEMVGPNLRVAGNVLLGRFSRLSDLLNNHVGLVEIRDASVLYRDGTPTRVVTPSLWVNLTEVTLVGQIDDPRLSSSSPEFRIVKEAHPLVVVTPGYTLTGEVYLSVGAELAAFIESDYPPFVPMTDVRTRSLADRRVVTRYDLGLLNRRHIVAATSLLPGMDLRGRTL